MKKIPVGSTIVGSYKFLFTNIVSIIGTMWFPTVLFFALAGALICQAVPPDWLHGNFKPADVASVVREHLPAIIFGALGLLVASLLVRSMVTVGIMRHALGEKTSTTFIYFSLGARVWRMVAAFLAVLVIFIVLRVGLHVIIVAVKAVLGLSPALTPAAADLTKAVFSIAGGVFIFYVMLRLFFFLPAVVVAENRIGVGRSWEMGKGNVWRMIGVFLVAVIPAYVVGVIAMVLTLGTTGILAGMHHHHVHSPAEAAAIVATLWPVLPVLSLIGLILAIVLTGLSLGAIGHAYKAVTAPEETSA